MAKAVVIKTDGTKSVTDFNRSTEYNVIKQAVGGWLESIHLDNDLTLYINEEGKLLGLPQNPIATAFFASYYGLHQDVIVGDVIFVGGVDEEGYSNGLTDKQVLELLDFTDTITAIS
jgi:Domain of unknown function (DUF3846)